jgi:DNA-binding NtrC family response regulator
MILLIEDDMHARRGFGNLLRMNGFEVLEAGDVRSALALLSEWTTIDLVIADLLLPDANGFELIDMLHAKYATIPLIVISGYFSETIGGAILDGTAHFMQKPINPVALLETVRRLLSTSNSSGQQ